MSPRDFKLLMRVPSSMEILEAAERQERRKLTESAPASTGVKLIGKKQRVETFEDPCCPHCDYVFPEKGGPFPLDRNQLVGETKVPWHEIDWQCPKCEGIMRYPESKGDPLAGFWGT